MLKLEQREQISPVWGTLSPLLAVLLSMLVGGAMFALLGKNPFEALRIIFYDPLFNAQFADYARPQLLVKAGPLIIIALGLSLGFRAGVWNIGAEGQYIMGALAAAAVGLGFYPQESMWVFPLMILAGAVGGFLWGMIPAILKIHFNTNEILVSLMLVYVAERIQAAMALGAMRNPDGAGFPGSRNFQQYPSAANEELILGSGLHAGGLFTIIALVLMFLMLRYHHLGFQIGLLGQSTRVARFSGVKQARIIAICLGLSGAMAGVAGMFELTGPAGQIMINFNVGYGFTAIIVAFLGRLNPWGIMLAGLLMALTYIGGELAQFMLGLPSSAIQAFQGMLLFFLFALNVLSRYRIHFTPKSLPAHSADHSSQHAESEQ